MEKKYSIEDLLNSLKGDTNEVTSDKNPREIWEMVANRESYEKMGFASESELSQYLKDNPYENL